MNIIVLTSSMIDSDFNDLVKKARIKPNPSNQNFYNKLIHSLATLNDVSVLSLRPYVKGMLYDNHLDYFENTDGVIRYYYPYIDSKRSYKLFKQSKEILEVVDRIIMEKGYDHFVLVVDTLRYALVKAAGLIIEKYHPTTIGVLTDNPSNISGVNASYVSYLKKHIANYDGYIALTETLNRILNINKKPAYIMEGLVEDVMPKSRLPINDYIFFGGALYEQYGVKRLVDSFHKSSCPYKLVIAGHGDLAKYISDLSEKDHRFLFLGLLDKDILYTLEQHAYMNINPRPFDWKMDRECIPSKLLEYLSSGAPTMSTKHTRLSELFPNNVYWINDDKKLEEAIESIATIDKADLRKKASSARLRVYELYGLRVQGEGMTHFINSINTSLIK